MRVTTGNKSWEVIDDRQLGNVGWATRVSMRVSSCVCVCTNSLPSVKYGYLTVAMPRFIFRQLCWWFFMSWNRLQKEIRRQKVNVTIPLKRICQKVVLLGISLLNLINFCPLGGVILYPVMSYWVFVFLHNVYLHIFQFSSLLTILFYIISLNT